MRDQISVEEAYAEACSALGEAVVMQRLLTKELVKLASAPANQISDDVASSPEV